MVRRAVTGSNEVKVCHSQCTHVGGDDCVIVLPITSVDIKNILAYTFHFPYPELLCVIKFQISCARMSIIFRYIVSHFMYSCPVDCFELV